MSRWKAAGIHLSISVMVAIAVGCLLYFLWFPHPYFAAAGASTLMLLLMGVDVCIGPLLTLIVFSPGKRQRALHFDLAVIVTLQAIAFTYGAYVVYQARPVFVVGEIDRLVLVAADEIAHDDLARATLPAARTVSRTGPRLVGVRPPSGEHAFDVVAQALATGKDIDRLPQYYVPYSSVAAELLKHARPLNELNDLSRFQRDQVDRLQSRAHETNQYLLFLPLERLDKFYTVIVRANDAAPVDVLDVDPWQGDKQKP